MHEPSFAVLVSWLLSYLLHSSVLLGLAAGAERLGLLRRLPHAALEILWRGALFGGLLTASLQTWQSWPATATATATAAATNATAAAVVAPLAVTAPAPARNTSPSLPPPSPPPTTPP